MIHLININISIALFGSVSPFVSVCFPTCSSFFCHVNVMPYASLKRYLTSYAIYIHTYIHALPFHSIPFHSIPFHSIPFHSIPFHSIPFHSIPFHSIPFHSIPFHSIPFHSIPFHSIPFHSIPFHSIPYICTNYILSTYTGIFIYMRTTAYILYIYITKLYNIYMHIVHHAEASTQLLNVVEPSASYWQIWLQREDDLCHGCREQHHRDPETGSARQFTGKQEESWGDFNAGNPGDIRGTDIENIVKLW